MFVIIIIINAWLVYQYMLRKMYTIIVKHAEIITEMANGQIYYEGGIMRTDLTLGGECATCDGDCDVSRGVGY